MAVEHKVGSRDCIEGIRIPEQKVATWKPFPPRYSNPRVVDSHNMRSGSSKSAWGYSKIDHCGRTHLWMDNIHPKWVERGKKTRMRTL